MKSRILLAAVLVVITAIQNPLQAQSEKSELKGNLNVLSNSGERNIDYTEDGHRYRIKINGSKIAEMSLDGKEVSADDFSKYDSLVKKIVTQIEKDEEQAKKDRAQAELDRQQAMKDRARAEKEREQAMRDRAQADKDREQAVKDRDNVAKDREQALKDRTATSKNREEALKDREQAERDRERAKLDRAQAEKDRAQAAKDREQAGKDRKQAEEDRKFLEGLLDEVVKEKLTESRESLTSLELDDTKLVINGKEQPDTLHKRFKAKFLNDKHHRINFKSSNGSRTMSVN